MKGLTDISGIRVGHISDYDALTGCTAVLCERGEQQLIIRGLGRIQTVVRAINAREFLTWHHFDPGQGTLTYLTAQVVRQAACIGEHQVPSFERFPI